MSTVWNAATYDSERRRLVPCFDEFYGSAVEVAARFFPIAPRILDLGAGTGIFSAAIAESVPSAQFTLLDASADMLQRAKTRLAKSQLDIIVQTLTDQLPSGPFDIVISALAIHHLSDKEKQNLYARIFKILSPGGLFLNAEQVIGKSERLQKLFEDVHLSTSRRLGSSEPEIAGAIERMSYDRCSTLSDQLAWLEEIGYEDSECFYRSFRFAVFGGWKPD